MKVILISGKAQNGKDTTAQLICEELKNGGHKVLLTHYADLLKFICKEYFGWNGEKDEQGRQILQYVGTDVIRKKNPSYWVDFVTSLLKLFKDEWEYVIIPDCRFPNEIDCVKLAGFDTIHLRVVRPNFKSPLTPEQQQHPSETALDCVTADYLMLNDSDKEALKTKVHKWISECLHFKEVS